MLHLLYTSREILQGILVPLCFITAWTFLIMLVLTLGSAIQETTNRAKLMHKIPCSTCQYFTNDYRLKCPVNPDQANTEQAINCQDYHPRSNY
ncbi:hypothetical protein VB715_12550 [Crocosphaera sp. UHCC 0190]|uniref:hypothetical protein n=1 Tax=Crocosphaera sp. UHCC 0190 TaxID=3110246 RepID=UPI002B207F6D|nr:hypothetical protein [Crocosphaera sp. UHCC 0190]MEA5510595.1 hypothetical protein [Crocosphaera sp. UHCC 0190]